MVHSLTRSAKKQASFCVDVTKNVPKVKQTNISNEVMHIIVSHFLYNEILWNKSYLQSTYVKPLL